VSGKRDKPSATRATAQRARTRARGDAWREPFLKALARVGVVSYAAGEAGVSRATAYRHREADEAFAAAWDEAELEAVDVLEREAFRRAVEGVVEPLVSAGQHVADVRRYSDRLLEFLMKARSPERFSERHRLEHAGRIEGGLTMTQLIRLVGDDDAAEGGAR
jgi:hypothetical protein